MKTKRRTYSLEELIEQGFDTMTIGEFDLQQEGAAVTTMILKRSGLLWITFRRIDGFVAPVRYLGKESGLP